MNAKEMTLAFAELSIMAGRWCFHTELAARAEHFTGRTPVKSNPVTAAWAKHERPRKQMCFMNSQRFALDHPDAKYYEGYWCPSGGFPVHHAWIVLGGKVYDFTAEACDRYLKRHGIGTDRKGPEDYFGMHVPTEFINEAIVKTEVWGDLLSMWFMNSRSNHLARRVLHGPARH